MWDIGLNLRPLELGAVLALAATLFGTPLLWWLSEGVTQPVPRLLLLALGNVGLAGLASLLPLLWHDITQAPLFAVLCAALLQPPAVLLLLLARALTRKS